MVDFVEKAFSDNRTNWTLLTDWKLILSALLIFFFFFEQIEGTDKPIPIKMSNMQKGYEIDHVHKHRKFLSESK